jgi:imidazolonepropionase-like amidohydrolase
MTRALTFCLFLLAVTVQAFAQEASITALKVGKLFDSENGKFVENQVILITGNIITQVGSNVAIPANAKVIDLSKFTALPGLIDCHTHITGQPENYYVDIFRKSSVDVAIESHIYTERTLEAGFTACRNLGANDYVDVALRNSINAGKTIGPRLYVSGPYIGSTGSHGDMNGFAPQVHIEQETGVADGVDGVRKKVRQNIKYGADVIKFGATAGVLSEEESVGAPQYSQEEMNAIVAEATLWGRKVAAHAHGTEGINMAIKAGVASIEHGSFLNDESIRLMKEKGTYLVADIYNDDFILAEFAKLGFPEKILEKERLVGKTQRENFQKAVKAGVKVAYGTDAGVYPHGNNAKQFFYMVKYGLSPTQALQSATINAADLIGVKEKLGSITKGKFADIIAINGNVEQDVTVLEKKIVFVMKDGKVYFDKTGK